MTLSHSQLIILARTALLVGLLLLAMPAMAQDIDDQQRQWDTLNHQRQVLHNTLDELEEEHQKFVTRIDNLKQAYQDGEGSRSDLDEALRNHLQTAQQLERLQHQLRDVSDQQEVLRQSILDDLADHQDGLESSLRQAAADDERRALIDELNDLQQQRRQFREPVPSPDQQRIDSIVADAQRLADDDPRSMLAAADELEDTSDQLDAQIDALDDQIAHLEQLTLLQQQDRRFSTLDRLFEDHSRSRTIARFDASDSSAPGSGDQQAPSVGDPDMGDGFDESEQDDSFNDPAPPESVAAPPPGAGTGTRTGHHRVPYRSPGSRRRI